MANATIQERRYPIGIQTFETVREGGYLYIDKTAYIHELAHKSGNTFFLSRPRRFGKSLLLSTMQAYFEGRRELFEGLAIDALEIEWEKFPVVRVDLSIVKTTEVDELRDLLDRVLRTQEDRYGNDPQDLTPGSRLLGIIQRAHLQTGKKVVVLIDEYDAPLLNVVHDTRKLQAFREVMREFYAPLKSCDEWLRFVFLTGITKFSQLSIFSELNNMQNISLDSRYAAICGITEQELVGQMVPDVETFAQRASMSTKEGLALLKDYYDGYHFTDESPDIYNPFSLLCALDRGRAGSYWFESGTPTFLINLLHESNWQIVDFDGCEADEFEFDAPAERMETPLPMLYQGGYLTIKAYDPLNQSYTLGIPNREVRLGLSRNLVQHAGPGAYGAHNRFLNSFANHVRAGELEEALQAMQAYLAGIPYHLGSKDEKGFQTTFYLVFDLLGAKVQTEFKTATGRVDVLVRTTDAIYVMEFKYDKSAAEALAQIDQKGYMLPFASDGRKLVKVGVNFSSTTRTIDAWVIAGE